jgi:D-alanyl-D-alanine carboxypeptidase
VFNSENHHKSGNYFKKIGKFGLSTVALITLSATPVIESNSNLKAAIFPFISPSKQASEVDHRFGHIAYAQAPSYSLQAVTRDGRIRLRQAAAKKFLEMQNAAKAEGISLVPISGFRTIQTQERLFYDVAERRNQSLRERAQVSAPPGHSEHHTGYAIDIGDGRRPATNLQRSFEQTAAFHWLQNNAARYGFELSFPRNNLQGINYEPWHWRFVGNRDSRETFAPAKNLQEPLTMR